MALPRAGTKTRAIVEFIVRNGGARYSEICRFIAELNGKEYRPGMGCGLWSSTLYGGPGKTSLLHAYFEKKQGKWCPRQSTLELLGQTQTPDINGMLAGLKEAQDLVIRATGLRDAALQNLVSAEKYLYVVQQNLSLVKSEIRKTLELDE